ncbi:unnamed protein product [Cyclocybe aegerita]|uniref:Uncharacterized protein n=1 Tax=Cyclocybe aegerita TaxID=1973307 RepID=A0A8S0W077_CYCAE|nr:unnamed protein product [Cyclocybe aegerita]
MAISPIDIAKAEEVARATGYNSPNPEHHFDGSMNPVLKKINSTLDREEGFMTRIKIELSDSDKILIRETEMLSSQHNESLLMSIADNSG